MNLEDVQTCNSLDEVEKKVLSSLEEEEIKMLYLKHSYQALKLTLKSGNFLKKGRISLKVWNEKTSNILPEFIESGNADDVLSTNNQLEKILDIIKKFPNHTRLTIERAAFLLLLCLKEETDFGICISAFKVHDYLEISNCVESLENAIELGSSRVIPFFIKVLKLCKIEKPSQSGVTVDVDVSKKAFSVEYRNHPKKSAIDHYVEHIKDVMLRYQEKWEIYYASYISLLQSSGYGKSRLVVEAGRFWLNTVYACIRSNSSGYPLVHKSLLSHFSTYDQKEDMIKFICATYQTALEYFSKPLPNPDSQERPLYQHCNSNAFVDFWEVVIKKCRKIDFSYENALEKFQFHQKRFTLFSGIEKESGVVRSGEDFELSELVIVLDEARSLLIDESGTESRAFRNLRSALRDLRMMNVIVVFTDTLSCLSNFAPAAKMDPSYRPGCLFNLLPPFYELLTMDTLVPSDKLLLLNDLENVNIESLVVLLSQGRPLWSALFLQENPQVTDIIRVIEFARKKLCYQQKLEGNISNDAILAVMSIRFGILGVLDHTVASDLMSSYMGTGADRVRMVVKYPAEPALSEAACQSLYRSASNTGAELKFEPLEIAKFMTVFIDNCMNGLISAGSVGELISRIILSLTFDKVILDRHSQDSKTAEPSSPIQKENWPVFSFPILLDDFLKELVDEDYLNLWNGYKAESCQPSVAPSTNGADFSVAPSVHDDDFESSSSTSESSIDSIMDLDSDIMDDGMQDKDQGVGSQAMDDKPEEVINLIPEGLRNGYLAFNTWTAMAKWDENDYTLVQLLQLCLNKRTAIILPPNHPGADLLIPVWLPDGRVGFLLLQIKNRVGISCKERLLKAGDKLKPEVCFKYAWLKEIEDNAIEYMSLYIEVGSDPEPFKQFTGKNEKKLCRFKSHYPKHFMLLGFESMKIAMMEPIKTILNLFCQRQVDNIEMDERLTELKIIEPPAYFGRSYCCGCKTDCSTMRCGCRKNGDYCSNGCGCYLNAFRLKKNSKCKNLPDH